MKEICEATLWSVKREAEAANVIILTEGMSADSLADIVIAMDCHPEFIRRAKAKMIQAVEKLEVLESMVTKP